MSLADARRTPRVLLVEDDRAESRVYSAGLRLAGFRVDVAETGEESLEALAAGEYDAVVLDVRLPDMTGLDVLRRMHAGPSVPVVVTLSAFEEAAIMEKAFKLGAASCLLKSDVGPANLAHRLHVLLAPAERLTGEPPEAQPASSS
jgi:DNA-binding response OmpR family regulator